MQQEDSENKELERLLRSAEFKIDNKDYQRAVKIYSRVIEIDPKNAWSYWERGIAKKAAKDLNGAMQDFCKSIELDPDNSFAFYQRALIKEKRGDKKGAQLDFEKVENLRMYNKVKIKTVNQNEREEN